MYVVVFAARLYLLCVIIIKHRAKNSELYVAQIHAFRFSPTQSRRRRKKPSISPRHVQMYAVVVHTT